MKKFLVITPFSVVEKLLLIAGDEVYAERVRDMVHIYNLKTRKYIGKVSVVDFVKYVKEIRLFTVKM